jgi:glycerol-3-phosphate dehydrogenase
MGLQTAVLDPDLVTATNDFAEIIGSASDVVSLACPLQFIRSLCRRLCACTD